MVAPVHTEMYGWSMTRRLDRDRWVSEALAALEEGGPEAVAVVPLARRLGVTRGSFYWHFESREELLAAVLERWEHEHVVVPLERLDDLEDARERLKALFELAVRKPPTILAQLLASDEPVIQTALERSSRLRTEFLTRAYRELGLSRSQAESQAMLAYCTYVGLAHLLRQEQGLLATPARRARFARHLAERLIPSPSAGR